MNAIHSKLLRNPVSHTLKLLPVIDPRAHNRLKAAGERTILEERLLSKVGVVSDYPSIWDTIKFHEFDSSIKARPPYVGSRVIRCLCKEILKKRKGFVWRLLDEVKIQGKMVQCHRGAINDVLGLNDKRAEMYKLRMKHSLDTLKGLLEPLIYDITLLWLGDGVKIKMKDIKIRARYWFGFINSNLILY